MSRSWWPARSTLKDFARFSASVRAPRRTNPVGRRFAKCADPHYPCCSFRGSIAALNTATGKVLWKSFSIAQVPKPVRRNQLGVQLFGPSGAGIWSSPAVDVAWGMLYANTGDSYSDPAAVTSDAILAFRLRDGEQVWFGSISQPAAPLGTAIKNNGSTTSTICDGSARSKNIIPHACRRSPYL